MRIVREEGMTARKEALEQARNTKLSDDARRMNTEIAEWLTLWMQSPEMFETWIALRLTSPDYKSKFSAHAAK